MNQGNFFSELKRRNVYKVAVAYAVIAWLVIEVASLLLPVFEVPAEIMKGLVVIAAGGFIVALVIAWSFEMTPEGMKRTEDLSGNERLPYWSRRKFGMSMLILAGIALALHFFQIYRGRFGAPASIRFLKSNVYLACRFHQNPERPLR